MESFFFVGALRVADGLCHFSLHLFLLKRSVSVKVGGVGRGKVRYAE